MKIDLHTHTRKCKTGDAKTREISPEDFRDTVLNADVGIIAVTNHNLFDEEQYSEILRLISGAIHVWPGVEFDVRDGDSRGHLLVIACPTKSAEFARRVAIVTDGATPDTFLTSIETVLEKFDDLGPLYIAHYGSKKPDLSDATLQKLMQGTASPTRVIKEVSNAISAGIFISHGHASIHGSDIHDWQHYGEEALKLPELRLPVDGFEHFCLLLEKDPTTINTALHQKKFERLSLLPFNGSEWIYLEVYNDINVFFGAKGTGKSQILNAIAKHYVDGGTNVKVFQSGEVKLETMFDLKCSTLVVDLQDHGISRCASEIGRIRGAREVDVTQMSSYIAHFSGRETNRNSQKIVLKNLSLLEESGAKKELETFHEAMEEVAMFQEFIAGNGAVREELSDEEFGQLSSLVAKLETGLRNKAWAAFVDLHATLLMNSAIRSIRLDVERKTGNPAKPATTGFKEYALNRLDIEHAARTIVGNIQKSIGTETESIGTLGAAKGDLQLVTKLLFQDGNITDSALSTMGGVTKTPQKAFSKAIVKILNHAFSDQLFSDIGEFNGIDDIDKIDGLERLLLCQRFFSLNGAPYVPSAGEASMLMLHRELEEEKDVYILDEPEKSLGNEYINDVIVPMIKQRARAGKRIFISTHDANIAVRTLPYSSVFRTYDTTGYRTYIGNPFTNHLVNPDDASDILDWKSVSMKTLEGGEDAFGERGKIYGKS